MYLDVVDDALADSDNLPDLGLVKHQEKCGHSLENAWGRVREESEGMSEGGGRFGGRVRKLVGTEEEEKDELKGPIVLKLAGVS